jgi:hypothetical protein
MKYKTRLALSMAIAGIAILTSPVEAQVKKSTGGRAVTEQPAPSPEAKAPKAQAFEKKAEGTRAKDQADDFWMSTSGAFHMSGNRGRAIYVFPAGSTNGNDTTWRFVDDAPVNNRVGWTYKEDGSAFYMFFPMQSSGGRYEILYSFDNENFSHYAWAE